MISNEEYDDRGNLIHYKWFKNVYIWCEYDENNNEIHYKDSIGLEYWREYDENNHCIHYKNARGDEKFWKYNAKNNERIDITEKTLKQIKRNKERQEFLSRKYCSRFEIMDI